MKVTFDTNVADHQKLLHVARRQNFETFVTTVTNRELLPSDIRALVDGEILEIALFGESSVGSAVLAKDEDAEIFENLLRILSNGAFPRIGTRESLSLGQRRQLRDALIYASHIHHGHDIFVTTDAKGFINEGRREMIQKLAQSRIMTPDEFINEFGD